MTISYLTAYTRRDRANYNRRWVDEFTAFFETSLLDDDNTRRGRSRRRECTASARVLSRTKGGEPSIVGDRIQKYLSFLNQLSRRNFAARDKFSQNWKPSFPDRSNPRGSAPLSPYPDYLTPDHRESFSLLWGHFARDEAMSNFSNDFSCWTVLSLSFFLLIAVNNYSRSTLATTDVTRSTSPRRSRRGTSSFRPLDHLTSSPSEMLPTTDSKQDGISSSSNNHTEPDQHLPHLENGQDKGVKRKFENTRGFLGLSCVTLGVIYGYVCSPFTFPPPFRSLVRISEWAASDSMR